MEIWQAKLHSGHLAARLADWPNARQAVMRADLQQAHQAGPQAAMLGNWRANKEASQKENKLLTYAASHQQMWPPSHAESRQASLQTSHK